MRCLLISLAALFIFSSHANLVGQSSQAAPAELLLQQHFEAQSIELEGAAFLCSKRDWKYNFESKEGAKLDQGQILEALKQFFKLSEEYSFKVKAESRDKRGITHSRLKLYFGEFEVMHGELTIHSQNQIISRVTGYLPPVPITPNVWAVDEARARQLAIADLEQRYGEAFDFQEREKDIDISLTRCYRSADAISPHSLLQLKPVYKIILKNLSAKIDQTVYVSATDGHILESQSNLRSCFPISVNTAYNGVQTIDVEDSIYLSDDCRNIKMNFLQGTNDHANGVAWGVQKVYDYLDGTHGLNGWDNAGSQLTVSIFGDSVCNAFSSGEELLFYVANNSLDCRRPLTTLDVVGHEYGHSILLGIAELNYFISDGATLHEGLADVFGVLSENSVSPHPIYNWQMSDGSYYYPIEFLRSVADPQSPNGFSEVSDTYGPFNPPGHSSSGIISHAFYLMAMGSEATDMLNDNGFDFCVQPMGMEKAAEILVHAILYYFTSVESLPSTRDNFINACGDLFGDDSEEMRTVMDAFDAVGLQATPGFLSQVVNSTPPGLYAPGDSIVLSASEPIYYTLDGSNVRTRDYLLSSAAIPYTGAIALTAEGEYFLKVRAFDGLDWSGDCIYHYKVCADGSPDADGDGYCDSVDLCPGFDDQLIGTACDDGDPCTENDVWQNDCSCAGVLVGDADFDGVCNSLDLCPGFDDQLIGTACDDGDPCTINDVWRENCDCAGIDPGDSDGDGVCDPLDLCPGADDADCDADLVSNLDDLDDDNDGVRDFTEAPSCYVVGSMLTHGERSNFVKVSTELEFPMFDPNYLVDGDLTNRLRFAANFLTYQQTIFQFDFNYPIELDTIFISFLTSSSYFMGDFSAQIQASNDYINWLPLNGAGKDTDENLETGDLHGDPTKYQSFEITENAGRYLGYRIVGNGVGIDPTAEANEIYFSLRNYFPEYFPTETCNQDTDEDGVLNQFDPDSDGDGCPDAYEAGATPKNIENFVFVDQLVGQNGLVDILETSVDNGEINYTSTYLDKALIVDCEVPLPQMTTPQLYPNPSSTTLNFFMGETQDPFATVSIIDQMGVKFLSYRYSDELLEIDVSELANGWYLLEWNASGRNGIEKFLKVR